MVTNKKVTGTASSMAVGLAIGTGISILLTVMAAAILAQMVLGETVSEPSIGYFAMGILLLASAVGSLVAAYCIKRRWMIVCLSVGALYYLTLLGCTALFFGGQYQGMGVTALVVLAGSGAVGLLGLRREKGHRRRSRKFVHR